jgi:hypothetical protein
MHATIDQNSLFGIIPFIGEYEELGCDEESADHWIRTTYRGYEIEAYFTCDDNPTRYFYISRNNYTWGDVLPLYPLISKEDFFLLSEAEISRRIVEWQSRESPLELVAIAVAWVKALIDFHEGRYDAISP